MTVVEELHNLEAGDIDAQLKRIGKLIYDMPTSWEDGARKATFQIINHSFKTYNRLTDLREYLDYLINEMGPESKKTLSDKVAAEYWNIFGSSAHATAEKNNIFYNFPNGASGTAADAIVLIMHISDILIRKQRDYGHENIARFGRTGLLVRTHDKIARLENLEAKQVSPSNESVQDNYIDVIGYSAIGVMWERGWFMLNMEEIK